MLYSRVGVVSIRYGIKGRMAIYSEEGPAILASWRLRVRRRAPGRRMDQSTMCHNSGSDNIQARPQRASDIVETRLLKTDTLVTGAAPKCPLALIKTCRKLFQYLHGRV
jgi:hypothetical protein